MDTMRDTCMQSLRIISYLQYVLESYLDVHTDRVFC